MIPIRDFYTDDVGFSISAISKQAAVTSDEIARALNDFRSSNRAVVGISSALLVIVFIFAMIGFVLFVIFLLNKAKELVTRFEKSGKMCKATVARIRLDEKQEIFGGNSGSDRNPKFWTVYAWIAEYKYVVNDIEYENKASIERYPIVQVGDEIEIIYLPNNPVISIRKELLQNVGWFYRNISETGENIQYTIEVPPDTRIENSN